MGATISPESKYAQEQERWNKPYVYQRFPAMLYKAEDVNGRFTVEPDNCKMIVQTEIHEQEMLERGWRKSPQEAIALMHAKEDRLAEAAAHRAYEDRNRSEAAQAEVAEYEASTPEHVAEIPAKRRGRPKGSKNKPKAVA